MKPGLNLNFYITKLFFNFEGTDINKQIFLDLITTCKKRFVVIPITIESHQNILIYDMTLKEVELFDPYGEKSLSEFQNIYYDPQSKRSIAKMFIKYYCEIEKLFKEIDKSIKFFKPVSFFPKDKEFQTFEINVCPKEKFNINSWGFCVVWSFWYTENRLRYPNKSRTELTKTLLDLFHKDIQSIKKSAKTPGNKELNLHLPICKVIRGYATFLQYLDKDLSYLNKLKLDFKIHKDIYFARAKLYVFITSFFAIYGYTFFKLLNI